MEVQIMNTWIVVADQRQALFYETERASRRGRTRLDGAGRAADAGCRLALKLTNPLAQPDRELETDRPGRAFSSSSGPRHAIDGERSTRRSEQEDFAKRVAEEMARAHHAGKFDGVVLAAGPRMLGLIRAVLPVSVRSAVTAEIAKDLVRLEGRELIDHVAADVKAASLVSRP
jgi:protein required for attachment to host cells